MTKKIVNTNKKLTLKLNKNNSKRTELELIISKDIEEMGKGEDTLKIVSID